MPNLLPTADVAKLLGVSATTVTRMVKRGDLTPAAKTPGLRGAYLFDPGHIAAYLATVGLDEVSA